MLRSCRAVSLATAHITKRPACSDSLLPRLNTGVDPRCSFFRLADVPRVARRSETVQHCEVRNSILSSCILPLCLANSLATTSKFLRRSVSSIELSSHLIVASCQSCALSHILFQDLLTRRIPCLHTSLGFLLISTTRSLSAFCMGLSDVIRTKAHDTNKLWCLFYCVWMLHSRQFSSKRS